MFEPHCVRIKTLYPAFLSSGALYLPKKLSMKLFSLLSFLIFTSTILTAQAVWRPVDESDIINKSLKEREIIPEAYSIFALDAKKLNANLKDAPSRENKNASQNVLGLPLPDGQIARFIVHESPCMSPVLSKKYPSIKSYRAESLDHKYDQARIDMGPMGFHAVIYTLEGTVYIDPYFRDPDQYYISYFVRDHHPDLSGYSAGCGVEDYLQTIYEEEQNTGIQESRVINKSSAPEVELRKYRLAVATTGEWGQIFGTKENVLARIVTGVNRLNMIFENEIATTFELVDNNDEIIFLDPATDPYVDANLGRSLIGQNSIAINNVIGQSAYDIGHIFTIRCTDGVAGIAALGSVCLLNKGNGVSCVGNTNISFFMVNTTAHEIGHQFNGGHSWSNCPSAMGQLSPGTAWEPGSGSTVLSYAGICGSQNIVSTNDDYFHVGNLQQFLNFARTTGSCAEEIPSGNHEPEIQLVDGDGLTIPIATPFELDGIATDEDGDILTYNWEQMDIGPTSPLGEPMGNAPSFRSFPPSTESLRLFPSLPGIIGGIGSNREVLPLYTRDLTFRFTVRDNHPGAGITVWEEVEFKATDTAGPFRVTSPNSLTFTSVNQPLTIEWDVANTDNELVNCQNVDIYFSVDNGKSFEYLLAENTPNDGEETVVIPNILTDEGKIKVKASNNIFFQFNRSNIIVREPAEPGFFIDLGERSVDACLPDVVEIAVRGTSFQAFDTPVNLELLNAPAGIMYEFVDNPMPPSGETILRLDLSQLEFSESYELTVEGTASNADTITQKLSLNVTGTSFNDLVLKGPDSGLDNVRQIPVFSWSEAANAENYTLEIATNPSFGSSNVVSESFIPDTSFIPQIVLDNSELYYWRILSNNSCVTTPSEVRTFGTASLDCKEYTSDNLPRNISFSGKVSVEGIIRVFDVGEVADVNINRIRGQHSDVFQLTGTLVSPSGTEVTMFDRNCFAATDFNIGFDNDSPTDFKCPLNSGIVMKPNGGDLSVLEGEAIDGDWIFRIDDNEGGEGGQFTEFDLEICASFDLEEPFIINNNTLEVPTGLSARIFDDQLLVGDNDNSADELIYTLVEAPVSGDLFLNGEAISLGDQFSQTMLNNGELRYIHLGDEEGTDGFRFTVVDGTGGWLDLTDFNILIADDIISSSEELTQSPVFEVFPNPARESVFIRCSESLESYRLEILGLDGRKLLTSELRASKQLDISMLENGLYMLAISNENYQQLIKLSIQK